MSQSEVLPFLAGLKICLTGFDDDAKSNMINLINQACGIHIEEFNDPDLEIDFLVLPLDSGKKLNPVRKAKEIVTNLYLNDCFAKNRLLPIQYFHGPMKTDQNIGSGVVFDVENFAGSEQQFIVELAKSMGMDYKMEADSGNKPITHLVSKPPFGAKYEAAMKSKIPVVDKQWLLECQKHKAWVVEKNYLVGGCTVFTEGKLEVEDVEEDDGLVLVSASALDACLQCIVCLDTIQAAPIYQCSRGHIFCSSCNTTMLSLAPRPQVPCPKCRIVGKPERSNVAEMLLTTLPLKCRFENNGCSKRMDASSLPGHEAFCQHRDIACFLDCSEFHPMRGLADHIKANHNVGPWDSPRQVLFINLEREDFEHTWTFNAELLSFSGKEFVFMAKHDHTTACFAFWIYGFHLKEDKCDDIQCKIKINGLRSLTYEGPIVSAEVPAEHIVKTGLGLVTSSAFIQLALATGILNVVVEVL